MQDKGRRAEQVDEMYRSYRTHLFGIAYRMLGSTADAEDLVQDVFVTMQSMDPNGITNLKAYLTRMVTNRCLNLLKSARKQREVYMGPWLPEPLLMTEHSPLSVLELDESLFYGFMVMLEQLSPIERVVFILRQALDYEYREIAAILGISESYSRQILSRAKRKVKPQGFKPPKQAVRSANERVHRFLSAFRDGNIEELMELLTEDVVIRTDGGGKVRAAINPIYGRHRVLIFLSALQARGWKDTASRVLLVNGEPGILYEDEHGIKAIVCFDWEASSGRIQNIYAVLNPDKLASIGF